MEITTPDTPELAAATKEYTDIATNPQNPRYAAFQRGDAQVSAYIDGLYKKAVPNSAPVDIGNEGVTLRTGGPDDPEPTLSPEDTKAVEDLTAAVLDAGGDLKLILKIASHFEQRMRGHQ